MKTEHKVEIVAIKCSEVFGALILDDTESVKIEDLYLKKTAQELAEVRRLFG